MKIYLLEKKNKMKMFERVLLSLGLLVATCLILQTEAYPRTRTVKVRRNKAWCNGFSVGVL